MALENLVIPYTVVQTFRLATDILLYWVTHIRKRKALIKDFSFCKERELNFSLRRKKE